MLEGLAAWVLKAYIGKYVNVNAHKLSVGLLSGVVELENVPLISEAFNDNDLPFELKFGYVGKIKLNISLNSLRYTPLVITAENLFIIIGPKNSTSQSANVDKLEKLNNLENKWFKEVEFLGIMNSTGGEEQSKLFSIFGPMAYSLLQNIHVNLNHFHIRYEDNVNHFSLGAYIDSISIQNDNDLIKTYDSTNKNLSFKSCEINNFSVYTDTNILYESNSAIEQMFALMLFDKITNIELNPLFKYIIQPTSLKSQIVRDTIAHPLRKRNKPRIKIISRLKEFHLNISITQLEYFTKLLKSINIHNNKLMSRDLARPDPINKKEWWQYIIKCVQLRIKKPTMKDFIKWTTDVNLYKKIYLNILKTRFTTQNLIKTNEDTITSQELVIHQESILFTEQQRIESEWNYKRLVKLRRLIFEHFIKSPTFKDHLVHLKLSNLTSKTSEDSSNYGVYGYMSWRLSNLKDYYFNKTPPAEVKPIIEQEDPTEYNKIDDEVMALINDSIENNSLLRRDTLLASLEFKLDEASIVISSAKEDIAELKFNNSTFLFEALPRHDSYLFQMNLGSFYLYDCVSLCLNKTSSKRNYFPVVVYPKNTSSDLSKENNESVFQLIYDHNPFQTNVLNRKKAHGANLQVKSCGLDIIYNLKLIENLKQFFITATKYVNESNSVKIKLINKYEENATTKSKLNTNDKETINLISSSPMKNLILDFEINAPKFIFPQNFYALNPLVVIFDFGRFAFKNRDWKNQQESIALIKPKTDAIFDLDNDEPNQCSSDSRITCHQFDPETEDDEDDIYETPFSTPPPQIESVFLENLNKAESKQNPLEKFYLTYDLHLNELQTIIGNLNSDNIQSLLNKGHSGLHFLEKFDINIQIDICKFKLKHNNVDDGNILTPLKINISLNLLKIHIDDLKLVCIYKTIEDLQTLFHNNKSQNINETKHEKTKSANDFNADNTPLEFFDQKVDHTEFESTLLTYISLNLNEIDMTISVNKLKDEEEFTLSPVDIVTERKSICELKIYNVNSELMSNMNGNQLIKFKIVGLLLIDARQLYGTDYQLLAASHNQVELDSKTGRIMDRINSPVSPSKPRRSIGCNEFDPTLNPLINIDLVVKNAQNVKEYILKSSFSTFDIILNPETISEIIMLFYSSFLSISSNKNEYKTDEIILNEKPLNSSESRNRLKINFEFSRLSVLMFKIENFEKANKIALFSLNGTSLEATILPEINYLKMIAKVTGLKISNLKEALKLRSNQKSLFGIGLQNDNEFTSGSDSSDIFQITYKKSIEHKETSELKIQMASLCYLHSPEFIYDLQCCFKDFMRFHAKTMETLTEKAASLALDMFKKGTTYLQNTIADIYQRNSENFQIKSNKNLKAPKIKLKILLQTPVIAIPMSVDSNLLLIAHLGHITINNNVANHELNNKNNQDYDHNFENTISDSTKFEVNLQNVRLFTIDLEKEKNFLKSEYEKYKGFKSESHEKVFVIENYFQIYYEPKCADKLIDETDVYLSLDCLPRFSNFESATTNIDGGSIRALSKINYCKIMLSKTQLEQLIKTLDNIVYEDIESKQTVDLKPKYNYMPTKSPSVVFSPSKSVLNKQEFIAGSESFAKLSSFKTLYTKFSELNDDLKSELIINVRFKIDKLQINFLADVEKPCQDVAELCFNEYELSISKHEKHVKFINMTLKSLCLIDKLKKSKLEETHSDDKSVFLLKSFSSLKSSQIKHSCSKNKKTDDYISSSLPNLSSTNSYFASYLNTETRNKLLNNFTELAKFYEKLSGTLSTSLPSEIPKLSNPYSTKMFTSYDKTHTDCPSTPPPSPSKIRKEKSYPLTKSESMSNLNKEPDLNESLNSSPEKKSKSKKCLGCIQQNMPLVSIRLIFIDKNHPKYSSKYLSINRYYKIKFSDLQLNVNPETWIILLDMLGLGSKIYSLDLEKEETTNILNEKMSSYNFVDKNHPYKDDENLENKPNTSIEFEVKHFAIQLNKSVSSSQFCQIRVKNVLAFIETKVDYLKVNGTLGSLEIYDISPHRGLYSDRFLTSGKQALEFEFFKLAGPPDILCAREYDNSFKLRMSSVKYVHTQRFLGELTSYFQQFNQLQDALGRMRALSIGQKNISCIPQRGSRVKLDIQAETPIVVLLVNTRSRDGLVLNLGNIKVENKFIRAEQKGTFNYENSKQQKQSPESKKSESNCLLDVISVQFTDTDVYSAVRFKKNQYEMEVKLLNSSPSRLQVDFNNFLFKQHSGNILERKSCLFIQLERNLENEISHKSPDWMVHAKLNSFLFSLDLKQFVLIRGILDQNLGEKVNENSQPTFLMPNTLIETVLTGEIWRVICINLDLENVSIELLNNHSVEFNSDLKSSKLKKSSLAYLAFLKSSLIYESNSDQSKLIDLVSSEIQIIDTNSDDTRNSLNPNIFTNILCNPKYNAGEKSKRLQLELHFRSNKISNRYSILINNCRVIAVFDWLLKVKNFLSSNYDKETNIEPNDTISKAVQAQQEPIEIKLNLTNTDLVLVENTSDVHSQAVILRLTAFIEYNQRKLNRPFESCLQSVELFSCQMSAIEETALSIIDPVTFSIFLTAKNSLSTDDELVKVLTNLKAQQLNTKLDYILDISTDKLKLRFSYLDFKLFIKLIESITKQIELSNPKQEEKKIVSNKPDNKNLFIHSIELNMDNFCICIIDDCKDVDIPLTDIQFNHLKMMHYMSNKNEPNVLFEQGSAEFGLNIDYYNRLLSGWEPLVEPWLARLNWKIKNNKNCYTLTSMDILNLNITNPFIDLITSVLSNWKDEYNEKSIQYSKRHKIFQPYKILNLTGEKFEFCTFKDTNSVALNDKNLTNQIQELNLISSDWVTVEDKSENQFNFYENKNETNKTSKTMHSNHHYAQRAHNYQLRELVQHRIRIKLNDWSEIKPLTIDKVGHYFRDINRLNQSQVSSIANNVTRLIFDISLSGNATKLIKIKSPVSIKNRLNFNIQCRIEPYYQKTLTRLGPLIVEIEIDGEISIPIKYLPCNMWFRPLELGMNKEAEFSSSHTNCTDVNQSGQVEYFQLSCKVTSSSENFIKPVTNSLNSILGCELFYFFAKVKRHTFPSRTNDHKNSLSNQIGGHFISIEPAFTLYNLLPVEFRYKFISSNSLIETNLNNVKMNNMPIKQKKIESIINGKLDSNKTNHFNNINVSNPVDLLLDIDNYRMSKAIEICPSKHLINLNKSDTAFKDGTSQSSNETTDSSLNPKSSDKNLTIFRRVNFYDEKNRPLFLIAKIIFKIGTGLISKNKYSISIESKQLNRNENEYFNPCPIVVNISAFYCFFNLTGLPLIFRQYNCDESAGQLEEHEMARSNQPLLFSFNETDSPYACSMRVGKYCNDFKSYFYNLNKNKKTATKKTFNKNDAIQPKWCKPFGLEGGSSYRALHVNNTVSSDQNPASESSASFLHPDWVYYIGIEIKQGKGLLRDTTFVYFSTRYYLVNRSTENLLIAQYFSIENLREKNANFLWENLSYSDKISIVNDSNITSSESNDSSETSSQETENCITLLNDSMTQFHWPRTDKDQLLGIRLKSDSSYNWSGGFKIDNVDSFYLNMRHKYKSNNFFLIKVEVILDGGTFFIVFSDTNDFPPPITVQNLSQVPIYFFQSQSLEEKYSITVKPNQSLNYSWDEPILEKKLTLGVKGGTSDYLDFSLLEDKKFLFYENFIYIVFSNLDETKPNLLHSDLDNSELVLTASNNEVYIDYKESGNRAQLWNMTPDGYLIHEGSSPPKELLNSDLDLSNRFVLDIDDVAPRPNHHTRLTLRRPDARRNNTQKWSFQKDGHLCCIVQNMCVQIEGVYKSKSKVVLGPSKSTNSNFKNDLDHLLMVREHWRVKIGRIDLILKCFNLSGFLATKVSRQRLRPGSGHLSVEMLTDGPTRVLKIANVNEKSYLSINWKSAEDAENNEPTEKKEQSKSLETYVNLTGGIGISIIHWIDQEYEELLYGYLKSLEITFDQDEIGQKLMVNVQSIQVCNQLIDANKQNLLYIHNSQNFTNETTTPQIVSNQLVKKLQPALHIDFLRLFKYDNIITIKHLIIKLFDVNLQVEEKLLWKIIQMSKFDKIDSSLSSDLYASSKQINKSSNQTSNKEAIDSDSISLNYYKSRINSLVSYSKSIKFSFNKLQIDKINMTLSVYKTSKLSPDLLKIKSSLGIPLIQFESARIDLKSFILMNEHDTAACILNLIKKHYAQALRENAIRILGSVDFLGNPLGFVVDFKESLTNVLSNGQVTDFVFSVTNSVANSVSKFSGFLSDELNELTLDERHRETRDQIRNVYNNGSIDHFVGGALGFAVGIVGGALSLATQTYRGFYENGVTGAFAGLGKGAVGTVSKPIVGMLDFTNGIASAIRETSKTGYKMEASRVRESRCCATPGALLTPFSRSDAEGQKTLYHVNNLNLNEKYISMEQLSSLSETMLSIITNQRIIVIKRSDIEYTNFYQVTYIELKSSSVIEEDDKIYIEILLENEESGMQSKRFRLENKQLALSLANKIRFAKADFDETFYSLPNYKDQDE